MAVSAFPSGRYGGPREAAQINITPLVDVLLVLLVIFMVSAPVLGRRIDLTLPQPSPHAPERTLPRLNLVIGSDGSYALDGRPLSAPQLAQALQLQARHDPRTQLRIDANADADYQSFARVLAQARNSGVNNIVLE